MTDKTKRLAALKDVLARVETATGPDREIDAAIWALLDKRGLSPVPLYAASLDACVALAERVLPGWWWSIGTCCVSDDARMAPDFNSPIHGERLRRELGPFAAGSVWDDGVDVDRRPPGNVPLAFLAAIFRALIAIAEKDEANG